MLAVSRLLDELIGELVADVPAALRWEWPAWPCSAFGVLEAPPPVHCLHRRATCAGARRPVSEATGAGAPTQEQLRCRAISPL